MLYTYLDAIGIKPGVDIEVISCDNSLLLDNLDIKPASFDLHLQQIASRSAEQLLWRMKNPKAQPNILIIEPELVKFDKV
jgi:DNA-binding LacI/PurR family transcriptional regulator